MLLTVDMGNTNIKIGVFDGDELIFSGRLSTIRDKTSDQYFVEIIGLLYSKGLDIKKIDSGVLSSVVPELTSSVKTAMENITGNPVLTVQPGIKTGINIKIDDPSQLGSDLLIAAVAASNEYTLPCLVVDLGTASKIILVDKDRSCCGGMIYPGMGVSLSALTKNASQLFEVPLKAPKKVISTSTVTCIQSGMIYGTASMIDGMIDRFNEEIGEEATVVLTGGFSPVIFPHCKKKMVHDQYLLLKGLKIINDKNS